ncbi:MAG: PEP-CTERM sorting domain-containing protein [Burkholderiales bacterium]
MSINALVGAAALVAATAACADAVVTLAVTPIGPSIDNASCIATSVLCRFAGGMDLSQITLAAINPANPIGGPLAVVASTSVTHAFGQWPNMMGIAWTTATIGIGQGGIPMAAAAPAVAQTAFNPIVALSGGALGNGTVGSFNIGGIDLDTGMPDAEFSYATAESLNVINVPEPSTWGMVLSGLALFGWIARRRVLT